MGIDLSTGTVELEAIDLALVGMVPLILARTWTSTECRTRRPAIDFGPGWRSELDQTLRRTLSGYTLETGKGAEIRFACAEALAEGQRIQAPGARLELRRIEGSYFGISSYGRNRDALEWIYGPVDGELRLVAIDNGTPARVELLWQTGRLVLARQLRSQRALRLRHDAHGRVVRIEAQTLDGHALGPATTYHYDELGRLTMVEDQASPVDRYDYDERHLIISRQRREGSQYRYNYDEQRRCIHAYGTGSTNERWLDYDVDGLTTTMTDSHGEVFVYKYNEAGQIVAEIDAKGDPRTVSYDDDGRVVLGISVDGVEFGYEYDELGRLVGERFNGIGFAYEYDDRHCLTRVTDWRGLTSEYRRDDRGRLLALVDPRGRRWTWGFNEFGEPIERLDPEGVGTRWDWDTLGRVAGRRDPNGGVWRFGYDRLGLMTSMVDPLGQQFLAEYDERQRIVKRVYPDGATSEYLHDNANARFVERRGGHQRWQRFNPCGMPIEVCDFEGKVSRFSWDTEQDRLLAFTGPDGQEHRFEYDPNGDLTAHVLPDDSRREWRWERRRMVGRVEVDGRETTWTWDPLGHLLQVACGDEAIDYEWDPRHFEIAKLSRGDETIEYVRDEFGQLTHERFGEVELHQQLDLHGRRIGLETSLGHRLDVTRDAGGATTAASWGFAGFESSVDPFGREIQRSFAGASLRMGFDAHGRATHHRLDEADSGRSWSRSFQWDTLDRLVALRDDLHESARFIHSPTERLAAIDGAGGTSRFYGYDAGDRLQWEVALADNHNLFTRAWNLEGSGDDWQAIPDLARAAGGQERRRLSRDAHGRLLGITEPDRTIRYDRDAAGRVVRKTITEQAGVQTLELRWDDFDRLVELVDVNGRSWRYDYDGAGRRIRKRGPDGETTVYVWDRYNLLYAIADGRSTFYGHHPDSNELTLIAEGDEVRWVVNDLAAAPAELFDADGKLETALERDPDGRHAALDRYPLGYANQWWDPESGLFYNFQRYYDPDSREYLSPDPVGLREGLHAYRYTPSPYVFADPLGEASLRPGEALSAPAGQVDTSNRTQINNPPKGSPYMGGHDMVTLDDGSQMRVDLGGATVCDVYDGDSLVHHTYNGRESGDIAPQRTHAIDQGASSTTWWHAEQRAVGEALDGQIALPPGSITSEPVTLEISRPPCSRKAGNGCAQTIPSRAQALADQLGRPVVVRHVDGAGGMSETPFHPTKKTGGC